MWVFLLCGLALGRDPPARIRRVQPNYIPWSSHAPSHFTELVGEWFPYGRTDCDVVFDTRVARRTVILSRNRLRAYLPLDMGRAYTADVFIRCGLERVSILGPKFHWIDMPEVFSMYPSSVTAFSGQNVTVSGRNFTDDNALLHCVFDGRSLVPAVYVNASAVVCALPNSVGEFVGYIVGSVAVTADAYFFSNSVTFSIKYPYGVAITDPPEDELEEPPFVQRYPLSRPVLETKLPDVTFYDAEAPPPPADVPPHGDIERFLVNLPVVNVTKFPVSHTLPEIFVTDEEVTLDVYSGNPLGFAPRFSDVSCVFNTSTVLPGQWAVLSKAVTCQVPADTLAPGRYLVSVSYDGGATRAPSSFYLEVFARPEFYYFDPPLGALTGGQTVRVVGQGYPGVSVLGCLWNSTVVERGLVLNGTVLTCPVPSAYRFVRRANDVWKRDPMDLSLQVSFSQAPALWLSVERKFVPHRIPASESGALLAWPPQAMRSLTPVNLTITGSEFRVFPDTQALCRFGQALLTSALITSSTTLFCVTPSVEAVLAELGAANDADERVQVRVSVSLDGGKTFGSSETEFTYSPDFRVDEMQPSTTTVGSRTEVMVLGDNFYMSRSLGCRFVSVEVSSFRFPGEASYISPSLLSCTLSGEAMELGDYELELTVDSELFLPSGRTISVMPAARVSSLWPRRGYYTGGTRVRVRGLNFVQTPSLSCRFGEAVVAAYRFISESEVDCVAPSCDAATASTRGEDCAGFTTVSVSLNGVDFDDQGAQPVLYQYVARQLVVSMTPWQGSRWDKELNVTLVGRGFSSPLYCRWLDLEIRASIEVTDTTAVCSVPVLPTRYRNLASGGLYVGYVEISPNAVDFTNDQTQFLFYEPAEVEAVFPSILWFNRTMDERLVVKGRNFRNLVASQVACLWYFDGDNRTPELVPAEIITPGVLTCRPGSTTNVGAGGKVKIEVGMTSAVFSDSQASVPVVAAPAVAMFDTFISPSLGGGELIIEGENLFHDDVLWVTVGDVPLRAKKLDATHASVTLPPAPHGELGALNVSVSHNFKDRLPVRVEGVEYVDTEPGWFYRPELHYGEPVECEPGSVCDGSHYDSYCPPGTYVNLSSSAVCETCPKGALCPRRGMIAPDTCPVGSICWSSDRLDSDLPHCPSGKLCLRPEAYARPTTVTTEVAESGPISRRLAELSDDVETVDCPEGLYCPPNSLATIDGSGLLPDGSVPICSIPGILCGGASAIPLALDDEIPSGYYVSEDGSTLIPCPPGFACDASSPSGGYPSSCPAGTYQTSAGSSECSPCTGGTVCPSENSALPIICPAGRVCALPGRLTATYFCPAGSFCEQGVFTLNTISDLPLSFRPQQCAEGTYCLPGTSSGLVDDFDPTAPRQCVEGYFCGTNETTFRGRGECPVGYYCVRSAVLPVETPKGYYVDAPGAYTPSRCEPGSFQNLTGQATCLACPDGHECTTDGTFEPSACEPGKFRSVFDASYSASENIFCHPCPQGTWNYKGQLTSESECRDCDARYVCAREGLTSFAPKEDTNCELNEDGVELCYQNSQAYDCPEGYACDQATTAYTQYDYPCEAGYFCKSLTALAETRNLLCPAGYYCREATGASKARAFLCPANWFCPLGTAGYDALVGSTIVLQLYNVQATEDSTDGTTKLYVGTVDEKTGAQCRNCDEQAFVPPTSVSTENCAPCGERLSLDSSDYVTVSDWKILRCPEGTTSFSKSASPDDCRQQGIVIAVVNIYNKTASVLNPRDLQAPATQLWLANREWRWYSGFNSLEYALKRSYRFGKQLQAGSSAVVDFLGFDPRVDSDTSVYKFQSITLQALDIMTVKFGFSKVRSQTYMVTSGNPSGHYQLVISSDKITYPSVKYDLPYTLDESDGKINFDFEMKFTSLVNNLNVNMSLELLHGSHLDDMYQFNDAVNINVRSPSRTVAGTARSFFALVSRDMLGSGDYELPYNMLPTLANQPGDISMVADLSGTNDIKPNLNLVSTLIPGATFWQVEGVSTVVMPWLPFFSACEHFDRHINLWDLLETKDNLPEANGYCVIRDYADIRIVQPILFDFATMTPYYSPVSDACYVQMGCLFEDKMTFSGGDAVPWMSLPIESGSIFYLTRDALTFEEVASPDFKSALGALDVLDGTDNLVPVAYIAEQRTGKFPRSVTLTIEYVQKTPEEKKIVSASLELTEFDDDASNRAYTLNINYQAMNWLVMMNNFQLPLSVYCIVTGFVGCGVMGISWMVWIAFRVVVKKSKLPRMRLIEAYDFHLWWALQGMMVATMPVVLMCAFVKVFFMLNPLSFVSCAWQKGPSSGTSVILEGTQDEEKCVQVRTGACLIVGGLLVLVSASKLIIPRLRAEEKEFLKEQNTLALQAEGLSFPAKRGYGKLISRVPVQWKRIHFIQTMVLLSIPLMILLEFSYAELFGNYTIYFSLIYNLTMLVSEDAFTEVVREKLLAIAFPGLIDVVFMIATIGADDLNGFIGSFFIDILICVVQRISLEPALEWIQDNSGRIMRSMKRTGIAWKIVLLFTDGRNNKDAVLYQRPNAAELAMQKKAKAQSELETQMEPLTGVAGRAMAACMGPFLILFMYIFGNETAFPSQYGIRRGDLIYYMLFCIVIIPFQLGVDIVLNHVYDFALDFKLHDYMFACDWKWRNRLTRWLLHDRRFDPSLSESYQSLHHSALSPQFYLMVAYTMWGGGLILFGLTCELRAGLPFFIDPVFPLLVIIMYLLNRVLDATLRWLIFSVFWKVRDNQPARAFTQSVQMGLKQKELEKNSNLFRKFFFGRHRRWMLAHVDQVFTPRGLERHRTQLSSIYQRLLSQQLPFDYQVPENDAKTLAHRDRPVPSLAVLPLGTTHKEEDEELEEKFIADSLRRAGAPKPQAVKEPVIPDLLNLPQDISRLTWAAALAWRRLAKIRVAKKIPLPQLELRIPASAIIDSDVSSSSSEEGEGEFFPDWLNVEISRSAREILRYWARNARGRVRARRDQGQDNNVDSNYDN